MKVKDKIMLKWDGLKEHGAVNIVVFGDSVTHGALGDDEFGYDTVYWARLTKKLHELNNYMPVNVINSGIAGVSAAGSLYRMDRDIFTHHPDLVIICFGLNDLGYPKEEYAGALRTMFEACKEHGTDCIFMTPNMMNTYRCDDTPKFFWDMALNTAENQKNGRMDEYMAAAKETAASCGVPVADVYSRWKELAAQGVDTTKLLANRINHPIREMHELFAETLFRIIMEDPTLPEIPAIAYEMK